MRISSLAGLVGVFCASTAGALRCGILVLCIFLSWLTSRGMCTNESSKDIWKAQSDSIRTMDIVCECYQGTQTKTPETFQLKMDRQTGMFSGRRLFPVINNGNEILRDVEYGNTGKVSWRTDRQISENTRSVYIDKRKQPGTSHWLSDAAQIGYQKIEKVFLPLHMTFDTSGINMQEVSVEAGARPGMKRITYSLRSKDPSITATASLVYNMDCSDGMKVLSAEMSANGNVIERVTHSEHVKIDGIWFPMKTTDEEYSGAKVDKVTTIVAKKVDLNKDYTEADFSIRLENNDAVRDASRGGEPLYYEAGTPKTLEVDPQTSAPLPQHVSSDIAKPHDISSATTSQASVPQRATLSSQSGKAEESPSHRTRYTVLWSVLGITLVAVVIIIVAVHRR